MWNNLWTDNMNLLCYAFIIIVKIWRQITILYELALSRSDIYRLFHNISLIEKNILKKIVWKQNMMFLIF